MTCLAHLRKLKKLKQAVHCGRLSAKRDTLPVIHHSMNKLVLTNNPYQATCQTSFLRQIPWNRTMSNTWHLLKSNARQKRRLRPSLQKTQIQQSTSLDKITNLPTIHFVQPFCHFSYPPSWPFYSTRVSFKQVELEMNMSAASTKDKTTAAHGK